MIDGLALALSAFCLLISRLRFIPSQNITVWKTNLVAAEYGHWLAIVAFALMVLIWLFGFRRLPRILSATMFFLGGLFFLQPVWQMHRLTPGWSEDLAATFGPDASGAVTPSVTDVWRLRSPEPVPSKLYDLNPNLSLRAYPSVKGAPWVIVIHGGGWDSGDADQLPELNSELVRDGIAVFSVNYRLAPRFVWPAQLDDINIAVEFIRAHATEFGIDPERWAIFGRSAGGQIAECAGYREQKHPPLGIIAFYSPSDMNFAYEFGREDDILHSRSLVRGYLGGTPAEVPANYLSASPINQATKNAPPTLLIHGPRDPLVWVRHSERLDARLRELGTKTLFIEIPWVTHGFDYNLFGPGGRVSTYAVRYFLRRIFT